MLRQPLIAGYILVGILAGPSVLDRVMPQDQVDLLAKMGIVLLLFVVGLKLDLHLIRTLGRVALATGLGQVLFTSLIGSVLMDELVLEHIQPRKIVANWEIPREDFLKGDPGASQRILTICKSVWQIYPGHRAKEEKVFFPPAMEYFSKREQEEMMKRF